MKLCLIRRWFTDQSTEGDLYLNGVFLCYTIEDRTRDGDIFQTKVHGHTAIPYGKYRVVLQDSPRFGDDTFTIERVPNFSYVRIHAGNRPADTEGCILVGMSRTRTDDNFVGRSRDALTLMKSMVAPSILEGQTCWLQIADGTMLPYLPRGTVPKEESK